MVEKGYKMLLHWKQSNAEDASYQILYDALNHRLVARSDLAQKYCVEWKRFYSQMKQNVKDCEYIGVDVDVM